MRFQILESHWLPHHTSLSPREVEVMVAYGRGLGCNEIADSFHRSPKTISTYRTRILEKIKGTSNYDMIVYCFVYGLVEPPAQKYYDRRMEKRAETRR